METENFKYTLKEGFISVEGKLDGKAADELVSVLRKNDLSILDFDGVSSVDFEALRFFLNTVKSGYGIRIDNANDEVCAAFEDSGVSSFVNISRKPKPLNIGDFEEFGAGFLSRSFNSKDGKSMLKVYGKNYNQLYVPNEKAIARAVTKFGISTPLVGSLYTVDGCPAISFEKIVGKRSFSRIIADEPERLEEVAVLFARKCKELHSTQADTSLFPDREQVYRKAVAQVKELTDDEKAKVLALIDTVPKTTTLLHGDLQLGNIIMAPSGETLWIDLNDFSYGNPYYDMGMWYFLTHFNSDEAVMGLFHITRAQILQVWDFFIREYYGVNTKEEVEAKTSELEKSAIIQMTYLGSNYGFVNDMEKGLKALIAKNL